MRRGTIDSDLSLGILARLVGMLVVLAVVVTPVLSDAMGVRGVVVHLTGWLGWVIAATAFALTFESVLASSDRAGEKQRERDRLRDAREEVVRMAEVIALGTREP